MQFGVELALLWAIDSLRLSSSFSTFVVRLNRCLTSAELYRCLGNRSSALFISFPLSSSTPCARADHLRACLKSFSTFATERATVAGVAVSAVIDTS